jgi:hypothetical protein
LLRETPTPREQFVVFLALLGCAASVALLVVALVLKLSGGA